MRIQAAVEQHTDTIIKTVRKKASAEATSPTIPYEIPTNTNRGRTLIGRSVVLFERKYLENK